MTDTRADDTVEQIKQRIDTRLNDCLCEMKPEYDDSITGFNEAWDIVRAIFSEELLSRARPGAEGVEPNEAMINTMRGIILKNTWSNEALVSHCRELLAVAQSAPTPPAGEADERVALAALERSVTAIDDWLNIFAPDLCDEARVTEARNRISLYGTLAYITDVQQQNRAALAAMSSPDERARSDDEKTKRKKPFPHPQG